MPSWMKWAIALAIGFAIIATGFRVSWGGTWILRPFFILNCLVLIIVVLLQSGKAADLAGAFGGAGSQTAFGPRGAANVLSKATTSGASVTAGSGSFTTCSRADEKAIRLSGVSLAPFRTVRIPCCIFFPRTPTENRRLRTENCLAVAGFSFHG